MKSLLLRNQNQRIPFEQRKTGVSCNSKSYINLNTNITRLTVFHFEILLPVYHPKAFKWKSPDGTVRPVNSGGVIHWRNPGFVIGVTEASVYQHFQSDFRIWGVSLTPCAPIWLRRSPSIVQNLNAEKLFSKLRNICSSDIASLCTKENLVATFKVDISFS